MNNANEENKKSQPTDKNETDENTHLFVYGNLKIIDKDTGEILVNKPF